MKKTLITLSLLCGLAGAAAAALPDNSLTLTLDETASFVSPSSGNSTFSLTLALNVAELRQALASTDQVRLVTLPLSGDVAVGYSISKNGVYYTYDSNSGLLDSSLPGNAGTNTVTGSSVIAWDEVYTAVVTFVHKTGTMSDRGSYYYLDLYTMDGGITSFAGYNQGMIYTNRSLSTVTLSGPAYAGVAYANWALSEEDISLSRSKVAPEPATATLSLLALAGLAARRRRK